MDGRDPYFVFYLGNKYLPRQDCPQRDPTTKASRELQFPSGDRPNMKSSANWVQLPDHVPHPQGKREDVQGISFRDQCARSIRYLRALSFNYLQGSEDPGKREAEEAEVFSADPIPAEDSEFEFASPASTPTRDNVLFCGRIMRQKRPVEREGGSGEMGVPSAGPEKSFPCQRSVSSGSPSSSGRQSPKALIGLLSFKADMGMSVSEMKRRQKQRERTPLFPIPTASGKDDFRSAPGGGSDGRKKTQMGLLRRMKPKGGAFAKALLAL